jgi:hypothetical protein
MSHNIFSVRRPNLFSSSPSCCNQSAGTCAFCASNCAACTAGVVGGICTACAAGFSLTYPNTCVPLATTTATASGTWTFGANMVPNATVCLSTPHSMAVSPTSAFHSVALTTYSAITTLAAANGDGACFGCANAAKPLVVDAGYQSVKPNEVYAWRVRHVSDESTMGPKPAIMSNHRNIFQRPQPNSSDRVSVVLRRMFCRNI